MTLLLLISPAYAASQDASTSVSVASLVISLVALAVAIMAFIKSSDSSKIARIYKAARSGEEPPPAAATPGHRPSLQTDPPPPLADPSTAGSGQLAERRRPEGEPAPGAAPPPRLSEAGSDESPPQPRRRPEFGRLGSSVPHPPLPNAGPAQALADALVALHTALETVAPSLDPAHRSALANDFKSMLAVRLHRLSSLPDETRLADWRDADLLPTLDGTYLLLSALGEQRARGAAGASEAFERVRRILLTDLDRACTALGWFRILPVVPWESTFDPRQHEVVATPRRVPGVSNLVVEVRRAGRLRLDGFGVEATAHVVVAQS